VILLQRNQPTEPKLRQDWAQLRQEYEQLLRSYSQKKSAGTQANPDFSKKPEM